MSRAENRQTRSRNRSDVYWDRRRNDNIILGLVVFVVFIVPMIYYGAIEYGWIHQPVMSEFKRSLSLAGSIGLLFFCRQMFKQLDYWQDDKRERQLDGREA